MDDIHRHDAEFLMIDGDFGTSRWTNQKFANQYGGGDVNAAIRKAGKIVYGDLLQRLRNHGIPVLIPAVGDHDIGDNDWKTTVKRDAIPAFRQIFSDVLLKDRAGRWRWNEKIGPAPPRPLGTLYENTAYAWRHKNVLIVSLDIFETSHQMIHPVYGYARPSLDDAQLAWLDTVLRAARADPSIRHIIVQGHDPVLWPVRQIHTSGMYMVDAGPASRLWQVLEKYGVDLYIGGEVHATTVSYPRPGGPVQLVNGGGVGVWTSLWVIVTVDDDKLVVKARGFSKSGQCLETSGTLVIDNSDGGRVVHGDGVLAPINTQAPLLHYAFDQKTSDGDVVNLGSFGNFFYAGETKTFQETEGVVGQGILVDKADAMIRSIAFMPTLQDEAATVTVWIKTSSAGICGIMGNERYAAAKRGGIQSGLNVILRDGALQVVDQAGKMYAACAGSGPLNDGHWHHVAIIFTDNATLRADFFVDGKRCATSPAFAPRALDASVQGGFLVGCVGINDAWHPLNGAMDEFKFWGRALSEEEIRKEASPQPRRLGRTQS